MTQNISLQTPWNPRPQQQHIHTHPIFIFNSHLLCQPLILELLSTLSFSSSSFFKNTTTKPSSLSPSKITSFDLWRQESNTTSSIFSRTQEFLSLSLMTTTTTNWMSHHLLLFLLQEDAKNTTRYWSFTSSFVYSKKLKAWLSLWPTTSSENLRKTPCSSWAKVSIFSKVCFWMLVHELFYVCLKVSFLEFFKSFHFSLLMHVFLVFCELLKRKMLP